MKNIVFHSDGFGDLLVCFKALYAIKQLYPEYKLFLLTNGLMESDFLEKIPFIDEVLIYKDDFFRKNSKQKSSNFYYHTKTRFIF
ncbi:hypothetical protein K7P79_001411 [Campylobacter coli]|nr:hypothetical protein [Campylobacter coli]